MKLSPHAPGHGPSPPSSGPLAQLQMLVVEDLRPQQQVIKRLLQELGCITTVAGDMRLALEYARYRHFHAVLIDSLVPDIDGLSSVESIRQVSAALGRQVYVVAMCGTADRTPQAAQLRAAADAQLRKPLRPMAVKQCLLPLVESSTSPPSRGQTPPAPASEPTPADTGPQQEPAPSHASPLRLVLAHVNAQAWNEARSAFTTHLGSALQEVICVVDRKDLEQQLTEGAVDVLVGDGTLVRALANPPDSTACGAPPWIALVKDVEAADLAIAAGAADFVLAPYDWAAVARRVQQVCRARGDLETLQQHRERLLMLQRVARVGEWALDPTTGELHLSNQARQLLRLGRRSDDRYTQQDLLRRVHPNDRERCARTLRAVAERSTAMECEFELSNGDVWLALHVVPVRVSGFSTRLRGTLQDVSARRTQEQEIRRLAYYDDVTGLPNRRHFREQLGRALDRAAVAEGTLAVLFIDLDEFKRINDTLGHTFGDLLLRQVADRLAAVVRESDAIGHVEESGDPAPSEADALDEVARMGGDEFVVLLTQLLEGQDAAGVASRIVNVLNRPIVVDGHDMRVTPSIGIALYPRDGRDVETLLRCADTAMYHAKSLGKNRFEYFSEELGESALRRLTLEGRLRVALRANEFTLAYQPKVALSSGRCIGVEALIRWERDGQAQMAPVDFLPVAESSGLIIEIGEWVLAEVLRQLEEWSAQGLAVPRVGINTSVIQFNRGKFCDVLSYVSEPQQLLQRLELDLTEHALMSISDQAISELAALRERGLRVAVDDFGTGYSSLQNLRRLPLDALKVDRSFISGLPTDAGDQAIVGAIISLGQQLGLEVVGEGVETVAQREWLAAQGCDTIQGFLVSRPVPGAAIGKLLAKQSQARADAS